VTRAARPASLPVMTLPSRDPHVMETGRAADMDGRELVIGSDYDCVQVGEYRFTSAGFEDLMQLLVAAHWQAGRCSIEQELRARDG
jgi:hypothetical protein